MSILQKIFSKYDINTGRQRELDYGKAVVIFFLAFIHCSIECTSEEGLNYGIPYIFDTVIGGPLAAPMFMFAMGVGLVFSKKNSPRDIALRGVKLGMVSYIFNAARFGIPYTVGYIITGNYQKYIDPLVYRVLGNDILQFVALAMLLMALLLYMRLSPLAVFAVSVVMSLLSMFFNGVDVNSPLGNIFLGYIIGTEDAAGKVLSDFPLMNWFVSVAAGYLFGKIIRRVQNKNLFYACISPLCALFTIIYFYIGITKRLYMFGEGENCYYHILTNDIFAALAAVLAVLGIYHFVSKIMPEVINKIIGDISVNINSVYCIHWVLIAWTVNVFLYIARGTQELSVTNTMFLSLVISVVSIIIAHRWKRGRV